VTGFIGRRNNGLQHALVLAHKAMLRRSGRIARAVVTVAPTKVLLACSTPWAELASLAAGHFVELGGAGSAPTSRPPT
jgi:hypothetical protein